jgi:hypothetical protein
MLSTITRLLTRVALDLLMFGFFFVIVLIAILVMWVTSWFAWAIAQFIA